MCESGRCEWRNLTSQQATLMMRKTRLQRSALRTKEKGEFLRKSTHDSRVNESGKVHYHMIYDMVPLCLPQWLHLFGFSTSDSTVKRAMQSNNESVIDADASFASFASRSKRTEGRVDTQMDRATRWCVWYIKQHVGDKSPTTGKNMMRTPKVSVWWELYKAQELTTSVGLTQASLERFRKALKLAYTSSDFKDEDGNSTLEVRKCHGMLCCGICKEMESGMLGAVTTHGLKYWQEQYAAHQRHQHGERQKYYTHRDKAKRNPNEYLSLIMDGMDQAKLKVPNYVTTTKDNSAQMDVKLSGVKAHGIGEYFYFSNNEFKPGANLNIECLHRTLIDLRRRYDEEIAKPEAKLKTFPHTLYLQVDGGSENKNRYLKAYCDRLVAFGLFKKVKVSYLMVGHTHEDIDQVLWTVQWDRNPPNPNTNTN